MRPHFNIVDHDDGSTELTCHGCGHALRVGREQMMVLMATQLLHDACPQCGAPYCDWAAPDLELLQAELAPFGGTVAGVLAQRGQADDAALLANIGHLLTLAEERRGLKALSVPERHVQAVLGMAAEVNNGGFQQFFLNAPGVFAHDLVPALEALGAGETLAIAREALARFGKPRSLAERSRTAHVARLTGDGAQDIWDDLDTRFYALEENLDGPLLDYIARHGQDFQAR